MQSKESEKPRVGLQTWILSSYRREFCERLGESLSGNFEVYAGVPRARDSVSVVQRLNSGRLLRGRNWNIASGALYLCIQPGLMKWLRNYEPDVLVLGANPRFLMNWFAAAWMRRRGRRVVAWGLWPPAKRPFFGAAIRMIWKAYANLFDAHILYSDAHAVGCRELGIAEDRIFVAPNSVLPTPPEWPPRQPSGNRMRVLCVGRLEARKKVDRLLAACSEMSSPPELWIVGEGQERKNLERLASSLNLSATFWGHRSGEELARIFLESDLFVLPGTGGLAVQEAMYYGLPVAVAEADGSQSDLVTPRNGWLLPSGDVRAIRSILEYAASHPDELRSMGRESWKIVRDRVNMDVMLANYLEALRVRT